MTTNEVNQTTSAPSDQPAVPPSDSSLANKRLRIVTSGLLILVLAIGIGSYIAFRPNSSKSPSSTVASVTAVKKIAPAEVTITSVGFVPASVTIKAGQAVIWTNGDTAPHWVASDPYPTDNALAGFNANQAMALNDSFSFVFSKVGTYTYHDNLNPYSLNGTVIVQR